MKVLITCPCHQLLIDTLSKAGCQISHEPSCNKNTLLTLIHDVDILIVSTSIPIDQDVLNAAHALKIIGRLGSGLEHIDLKYAELKKIKVISTPAGNARAVAEHVLGLLLGVSKHIFKSIKEVKNGKWLRKENTGFNLEGKSVGIVGYGNNGAQTAKLLSALGMKVYVYDKYKNIEDIFIHKCSSYLEIVALVDVLSFHVPYTPETHHLFNEEILQSIEKPIVLINISRGEVVDSNAVLKGLERNKIAYACLDVIENEKVVTNNFSTFYQEKLFQNSKVFITPHIAGYSTDSDIKMAELLSYRIIMEL